MDKPQNNFKAKELVQTIIDSLNEAKELYDYYTNQRTLLEMERTDILHELELSELTWGERHKWSIRLTEVLQERRIIKREKALLEVINKYLRDNPKLIKDFNKMYNEINKQKATIEKLEYIPKIRTDLKCGVPVTPEELQQKMEERKIS